MAKKKKEEQDFDILAAEIKDGYCNYHYRVASGVGLDDEHKVKGSGIVDDDMYTAFNALKPFMAHIDDVFKHANVDIIGIESMHAHELTQLYDVTGFKLKGTKENQAVILVGTKHVNVGGRIGLETPKIALDDLSSYKFFSELRERIAIACTEVLLYKGGKYTIPETKEENPTGQLTITDQGEGSDDDMDDFKKAKQ